jgi:hypothetical protein
LNFSRLVFSAALLCGITRGAEARQDPTPKPSGVVVHLFGPDSIMSKITPDLPGETAQPATAQPGAGLPDGSEVSAASGSAASASQPDESESPSMSAVLHQMFVVGDPDHPNTPSVGRSADRTPTGN